METSRYVEWKQNILFGETASRATGPLIIILKHCVPSFSLSIPLSDYDNCSNTLDVKFMENFYHWQKRVSETTYIMHIAWRHDDHPFTYRVLQNHLSMQALLLEFIISSSLFVCYMLKIITLVLLKVGITQINNLMLSLSLKLSLAIFFPVYENCSKTSDGKLMENFYRWPAKAALGPIFIIHSLLSNSSITYIVCFVCSTDSSTQRLWLNPTYRSLFFSTTNAHLPPT